MIVNLQSAEKMAEQWRRSRKRFTRQAARKIERCFLCVFAPWRETSAQPKSTPRKGAKAESTEWNKMGLSELKITDSRPLRVAPALDALPQRWWLLALLFTAMLISYVHRSALSVAAPFISRDLNLSKAEMGILLSSFFWVYAFMQVPAGWIVDRFGVRRAYSFGFIFWSLASSFTGFGAGVASLLGLRVATGAGQGITFPASARPIAHAIHDRGRA